jgi:GABA permease
MRNPLKDEETAFRVVLGTIAYLGLIVLASWLATWLGVVTFVVLTVIAVWILRGGKRTERSPQHHVERAAVDDTVRILVVANETVGSAALRDVLRTKAADAAEDVLVVCPALNSPVRTWTSDEDGARAAAEARLRASLEALTAAGVTVRGEIGDGDPLQALEDALRTFPADEIVISTHAVGRSHWLERGVVETARARFDVPITHVIGDGSAEPVRSPSSPTLVDQPR